MFEVDAFLSFIIVCTAKDMIVNTLSLP